MTRCLIVEDGRTAYVLPAARSLARAGFSVGLAGPVPSSRLRRSRHVDRWHRITAPEDDHDAFLADVATVCREGDYAVVFGADDIETLALSAGRDRLPGVVLPLAPHDQVLRSVDKLSLTEAASRVGVGVPGTTSPDTTTSGTTPWADLRYPLVVKARLHWTPGAVSAPRHLIRQYADGPAVARDAVALIEASGGAAVLQQVVTGHQIALSVVLDRAGDVRAVAQQRSELQSAEGPSIRACTTAVDPELLAGAERLLRELRWLGLANLQYLVGADRVPRLIDLNGRFYGTLALAVAAGADLPAVWAAVALGRDPGPRRVAVPGVRFVSLERDLRRIGGLPGDRVQEAARSVRYAVGAVHQTWSPADPLPALAALTEQVGVRARRSVRRLTRAAG